MQGRLRKIWCSVSAQTVWDGKFRMDERTVWSDIDLRSLSEPYVPVDSCPFIELSLFEGGIHAYAHQILPSVIKIFRYVVSV